MNEIRLGNYRVTDKSRPYIIAEIGVNHGGSIELAKTLIDMAVEGGADAAKFQTYKAEKLAAKESPSYWDTSKEPIRSQFELFQKFDSFEAKDYIELKHYCDQQRIDFLSTPFDADAVTLLDDLVPFFKIASADITNTPLLRQVAACGKPVVLSTGAAKFWEIDNALAELKLAGATSVSLLHCMLNYPTAYRDAGLSMISSLKRAYPNLIIGYSDHTVPEEDMLTLTTSVLLGARIIEKHFTHDKTLEGNDHYHAMNTEDLRVFRKNLDRLTDITADVDSSGRSKEVAARLNARRSIVAACDIAQGKLIEVSDLTYKRPAFGISPMHWDEVIGMKATKMIAADELLYWKDLEN